MLRWKGSLGILKPTGRVLMRFDGPGRSGDMDSASSSSGLPTEVGTTPPTVVYRTLPESMLPKEVPPSFTPFPLPKYDPSLGFGPVRLQNVPDIEMAQQRLQAKGSSRTSVAFIHKTDSPERRPEECGFSQATDEGLETSAYPTIAGWSSDLGGQLTGASGTVDVDREKDPLGGYRVCRHYPLVDRLECHRSVDDLLEQFRNRTDREARTACIIDLASTLNQRTNEELQRIFYEISAPFTHDGNGLRFLVTKVVKFGRPYYVVSELTKAYTHLVQAATETLVEEQPERLAHSPALFIQLLHFLALIRVFEPNRWSSFGSQLQNRADYSHPRGVNNNVAHQGVGEDLFDRMKFLVMDGPAGEPSALLDLCTSEQLLDIVCGFAAVMPSGKPEGIVANPIIRAIWRRWEAQPGGELSSVEDVRLLERFYFVLRTCDMEDDMVLSALLGVPTGTSFSDMTPLRVGAGVTTVRSPDFFSAVSRDKRREVKERALTLLQAGLDATCAAGSEADLQALLESGEELLMTLSNKEYSVTFAKQNEWDSRVLRGLACMAEVAERLQVERTALALPHLSDVQVTLEKQRGLQQDGYRVTSRATPNYLFKFKGQRVHPIRTLLSSFEYVSQLDNVFLLHSSITGKSVDSLVAAIYRLKSGKDGLVVSTACLRSLHRRVVLAPKEQERETARRALEILSFEIQKGRVILIPVSEELHLHDEATYYDEDIFLWTVAAYFARELPLVKVHALMSSSSAARHPHHTLKGEHTPLTSSCSVYDKSQPLLSALRSKELLAVTHLTRFRPPVRDRPNRLYYVNPIRSRFVYRRDKGLFDKIHVTARNLAPGFSRGALASDLRGLGYYTPDHPQVPYQMTSWQKRVRQSM